ncbi:hypothetical protein [Serratia sp. CY43514]
MLILGILPWFDVRYAHLIAYLQVKKRPNGPGSIWC